MRFEDVTWHRKGITINLPRSKTDQEARGAPLRFCGRHKQTCPVTRARELAQGLQVKDGFVFAASDVMGASVRAYTQLYRQADKATRQRTAIESPELYGGTPCVQALSLRPRLTEQRICRL